MAVAKRAPRGSSSSAVEKLREDVHGYHLEVTGALATMQANCLNCREQMRGLDLQINGDKPEKDDAPSMRADIKSLKSSRNSLRRGVQVAWVVITALGSLVAGLLSFKPWKS